MQWAWCYCGLARAIEIRWWPWDLSSANLAMIISLEHAQWAASNNIQRKFTPIPQVSFHYPRKALLLHCKIPFININHSTFQGCKEHVLYTINSHHFLWRFYLFPSPINDTMSAEGLSFSFTFLCHKHSFWLWTKSTKIIGISKWGKSLWSSIQMTMCSNHLCNTGPSEGLLFLICLFHRNRFSTPESLHFSSFPSSALPMPVADILWRIYSFKADYNQPWGEEYTISLLR